MSAWILIVFMFGAGASTATRIAEFKLLKECLAAEVEISKRFEKWASYAQPKSFCFHETGAK